MQQGQMVHAITNPLVLWRKIQIECRVFVAPQCTVEGYQAVADQAIAAIKRRLTGQHKELLHLYLLRIVIGGTMAFTQLLGYPAPQQSSTPA